MSFDGALIARTRAALELWEASGGGPTSTLTGSGAVGVLEREFAELCGARHALALPTGTLALRVALAACGVGPGDQVLVPALDWPAAVGAVLSLDARPAAVDSIADSFLVDPEAIATRITAQTRAVVVTHLAGMPAAMRQIQDACAAAGVPLVEDASQALGARIDGRQVGGFGTAGVFSLGPGKLLDAGEGGMLVTDSEDVYRQAVRASQSPLRQLIAGVSAPDPCALAARIHPLAAILAVAGLRHLDAELERRRGRAEEIVERARSIASLRLWQEGASTRFSWPCVPAAVPPGQDEELAGARLAAEPLGSHYIPELLDEAVPRTPNARALSPLLCRLHLLA
jgi:dTDP-4-amino-4,6-dideoxygalactose transaminase